MVHPVGSFHYWLFELFQRMTPQTTLPFGTAVPVPASIPNSAFLQVYLASELAFKLRREIAYYTLSPFSGVVSKKY